MKRCKVCRRKPGIERRVNSEEVLFCLDDCYEAYEDFTNDHEHPCIDDCEAVRSEYMEWMKNYESDFHEYRLFGNPRKEELVENFVGLLYGFHVYGRLEGTDSIFF